MRALAARHQIHPAIIVGQIQYQRHRNGDKRAYGWLRKYLTSVKDCFADWDYCDGWDNVVDVNL